MVTLITVNYNRKDLLKKCLDSIFSLDYPLEKLEVIVVDNGSSDGSAEFVKQNYPLVKLIHNPINNYCLANNLAIKNAQGQYIGLINNDVELDKNWLKELLKVIQTDPSIGALTSKILFFDKRINSTGHIQLPDFYWQDRGFLEEDIGQYERIEEVESISHCACLYKKSCLDEVGLLDEDFNMYLEDVDMSIRLRKYNYKLYYVPKAICYHRFHGTVEQEEENFYYERNRLLLMAKHFPEKLADHLYGKGYFTLLSGKKDNSDIFRILSSVFLKLFKSQEIKLIEIILPDIINSLGKIINLERYYLLQKLDEERQKNQQVQNLYERLNQVLIQKEAMLKNKDRELNFLNAKIKEIYNSQTYRFIARPLWFLLGCLKAIRDEFILGLLIFRKKYNLCFAYFSIDSNTVNIGRPNYYHIKITNVNHFISTAKLKISIEYNGSCYAYFTKILNLLPESSSDIKFEYDWRRQANFYIDNEIYQPEEIWYRGFVYSGLYRVNAILYDIKDRQVDNLTIYQRLD
jgi:GT2 family glycosyltransferase